MISIDKLYFHWTTMITMTWGAASLLVIPMLAIWMKTANPTNYDTWIIIGLSIGTLCCWLYNYAIDEAHSSQTRSAGLKRIFDDKTATPEQLSDRVERYNKMF